MMITENKMKTVIEESKKGKKERIVVREGDREQMTTRKEDNIKTK